MPENFTILNEGAALERPTFLIKLLRLWVPGPCRAVILDCRVIHTFVRMVNTLTCKDCRPSWTSGRPKTFPVVPSSSELRPDSTETTSRDWNGKRIIEYADSITSLPKLMWNVESHWWNLFRLCMMDYPRIFLTNGILKISLLYGMSNLEDQLQNWGLFTDSRSSSHSALAQRKWDC